jgi:hypothetical protein
MKPRSREDADVFEDAVQAEFDDPRNKTNELDTEGYSNSASLME